MNDRSMPGVAVPSFWLVILCLAISLAGIFDHDLWTPDEPREAAIMLSMSRSGNLIVPELAGEPFVEKPPLYYAVGAGALRLLGPLLGATTAGRLTSVLWGLGALLMTALLARRLLGAKTGLLAVLLLATMPGFIHVTHWMLVDNALLFFVTAALWCFAEAYIGLRSTFLLWAALFTAGAFLSKGFIGPLVIFPGWLSLVFSRARQAGVSAICRPRSLALHGLALVLCLAPIAGWMLALRAMGGEELWREWFWVNHFGRFSGDAVRLGHIQPPWYYLPILPVYLLPWVAVVPAGVWHLALALWRRQITAADRFLGAWALGGLLVFSMAATKRDVYLSVLLPAFAMLGAPVLIAPLSRVVRISLWLWVGCMLGGLLIFIVAPLLAPQIGMLTGGWGWNQAVAGVVLIGCLGLVVAPEIRFFARESGNRPAVAGLQRSGLPASGTLYALRSTCFPYRVLAATALFYIGGMTVLFPLIDRHKSYGTAFQAIAGMLPADSSACVAGWRFDETTRAGFYYYCGLVFPALSDIKELRQILEGHHPRFGGVLALSRSFPPRRDGKGNDSLQEAEDLPAWRVRQEVRMGPRRRLQWIEGGIQTDDSIKMRNDGKFYNFEFPLSINH